METQIKTLFAGVRWESDQGLEDEI